MTGCSLTRNAANYGGGFMNKGGGKMYIDKSTLSENRSTDADGGGGAAENNASTSYINNSTLSNNKSTEIGGAINNNNAAFMYIANSSITGNVAYGDIKAGAIANNSGTVYAVNCLFAYNYHRNTGTTASPTTYVLDDVVAYAAPGNVHLRYCIYHADLASSGVDYSTGHNIRYSGAADGSDNTIFSGGIYTRITDGTGQEIGNTTTGKVFQPFLYNDGGGTAPVLKTGSFVLNPANRGAKTGYTDGGGTPVLGYYDRLATTPAWVNLVGSTASSYPVTTDQVGVARTDPPAAGAIESALPERLYMLKINYSADGSVTGGTVYGDVYPSGTQVVITAIPNTNRLFDKWDYVTGGTGIASNSNSYTVTVDRDITLVPVFKTKPNNTYNITYIGNGNTSGVAPAGGQFTGATTISGAATMTRAGYIFSGWNTAAAGTGTAYAAGATYGSGSGTKQNLTLYAQWTDNFWHGTTSTNFATAGNWGSNIVPAANADIIFAEDATRDLVLDMNRQVGNIQFSGANYKLVLGNYNVSATGVTNYNSTRYVQTNGTGVFCVSVADGATTLFPVGNSAYNPVTIENKTGATDVFCVKVLDELYKNGSNGATVTAGRVKRTWNISKDNPNGGAGVNFVFNWNTGESEALITPGLLHYSTGWSIQNSGVTSSTANSLSYTGYTGSFSPFGIADVNDILPLTWLSFDVRRQNDQILLAWSTAQEMNSSDFVIQHSVNGKDWESIGVVKAAGNSSAVSSYQFVHTNPSEGTNFYRIQQRDLDGRSSYSDVKSIRFETTSLFGVYPNPVINGVLNVGVGSSGLLKLFTENGQLILSRQLASAGRYSFNLGHLAKGIYRLSFGNKTISVVVQ